MVPSSPLPKMPWGNLEPKGAGTGQVVTYQAANPFWNEGRFIWSLLSWRECPRNEIFKSHWWQRLTPALGSSERPSSVWKRKEWSSSIEKQSWLQPDEVKAAFCDGREVGRRCPPWAGCSMMGPFSPRVPVCTYPSKARVISSKVLPRVSGTLKKVKTQKIMRKMVKKRKTWAPK